MPSLVEAIEAKYGEDLDSLNVDLPIAIYVPRKSPRCCIPSLLVLNDCAIDSAGDVDILQDKCQRVEELDLAQNSLQSWTEVINILSQMPRLRFANLSFNALRECINGIDLKDFPYLKMLVLNSTNVDWASVRRLLTRLPSLEELHLSKNEFHQVEINENEFNHDFVRSDVDDVMFERDFNSNNSYAHKDFRCCDNEEESCDSSNNGCVGSSVSDGSGNCCVDDNNDNNNCTSGRHKNSFQHHNLKRLHFTGNPISCWREVRKLGHAFPSLESLVLAHCPVSSLDPNTSSSATCDSPSSSPLSSYSRTESECESSPPRCSPHDQFRQLRFLNLNSTLLSSWDDVERLGRFPVLENLRIQNCPLFEYPMEYTEHERRQLLIARLPNVLILNGGGVISVEEREDAERAFIRYYMEKPESDRPERYSDLIAVHGKLDPLVNIDLTPKKKIMVTITCPQENLLEERLIDVYQTVMELKQKLESFSKIPVNKMRLFYVDQDMKSITGPEEMKYPNKQLYSYNISGGDEIIVSAKLAKTTSVK